jgi:hypothetical protein
MDPYKTRTRSTAVVCRRLLAATLLCGVAGCGKQANVPSGPQSPPRPLTWNGHVFTAQMDMPARPVPVPPGEM